MIELLEGNEKLNLLFNSFIVNFFVLLIIIQSWHSEVYSIVLFLFFGILKLTVSFSTRFIILVLKTRTLYCF